MSTPVNPASKTESKGLWDRILTTTPVLMTILSTLLAGLSSSEMTQAQYYRSLAAQNQSRAGDQWGFFQAKRIRGSSLENTADLLQTQITLADASEVENAAQRLVATMRTLEKNSQEWLAKLNSGKPTDTTKAASALKKLNETAQSQVVQIAKGKLQESLHQALDKPEVRQIFDAFPRGRLPMVEDKPIDDPGVKMALKAIAERKPDSEVDQVAGSLSYEKIHQALETAQINAKLADEATESLTKGLAEVDQAIQSLVNLAVPLVKILGSLQDSFDSGESALSVNQQSLLSPDKLRDEVERLQKGFKAVQHQYNGLRNRREADYNQKLAYVYEVQVHKNGLDADRHRQRSKNFFYGMLVAQAAMAISSFALAARQKSVLWALACLAGLTAVAFSGYVYLSM
jgi:hypothetical protein